VFYLKSTRIDVDINRYQAKTTIIKTQVKCDIQNIIVFYVRCQMFTIFVSHKEIGKLYKLSGN